MGPLRAERRPWARQFARPAHVRSLLLAGLAWTATIWACASGGPAPDPEGLTYAPRLGVDFARMSRTPSGLWIQELAEGTGREALEGDQVRVHYVGYLPDGTVVDASVGGEPVEFRLGADEVIRGWNLGIRGMKVGGRRRLVIPPDLAYGARGRPPGVPGNAVLVFEIQLLAAS